MPAIKKCLTADIFYGCTLRNLPRRSQAIPRQIKPIAKIRMASSRAAAAQAARKTSRQFFDLEME
jgi:hypothetical protein